MIRVEEQLEPPTFDAVVRQPGIRFLARNAHRNLRSRDFDNIWSKCLQDLRDAYGGICAYTASFVALDISMSVGSVDHFIPKTKDRNLAYEWSNYRFCTPRVNNNKDMSLRVMDPFKIQNGWFILDFDTYLVKPSNDLPSYLADAVQFSIDDLGLNDDDRIVQSRVDQVDEYIQGHVSFDFLERKYPFIASELKRQGLITTIKARTRKGPDSVS